MRTEFVGEDTWPQLTQAIRRSRQRCAVAVAYFGIGGSRLLPLPRGSRLVVDASERSIASGQTCPDEIIKLTKRGVTAFSVPNLHAKVFVLGRTAYIGSPNVSSSSALHLVEALVRTTEPGAVRAAKEFVHRHCLHELTPKVLEQLTKLYRPPVISGGMRSERTETMTSKHPSTPRIFLAQLHLEDWSERDEATHQSALVVAKKRRKHPRTFELDSFRNPGRCIYQRGDLIIQVTDEGNGRLMVAPPGNVLHVKTRTDGARQVSFVYLERAARRRRKLKSLASSLGCTQKRLRRDGVVRDASFAQALLSVWAVAS